MPLYDYQCQECQHQQEEFFKLSDLPETVKCEKCNGEAKKIITFGHGGLQCDGINDVPWLESALKTLQPDGEKPLQTRSEYKQYLKDKKLIAAG